MSCWWSRAGTHEPMRVGAHGGADARLSLIRDRIRAGFYETDAVVDRLARRLLESDALGEQS